ncbi:FAD-binding oxidoreductase [Flavimaricola marinus]|uniref:D-lactate dehydrogenase (cytochrome) n=1 Tax=Flavimaricola marinus TaxID=1819565 RepID=A0A238LDH7_9RHOB|nr:FAD-linked oxidase C-terminal domain-containing protein [Flavimaricola marinus]SMY07729.1 putative FAD-linked oxidoreductase [Flavimaricola marinus]
MTIETALEHLKTLLGDRFSRTKAELDHHSRSESHFAPIAPNAVVWPISTAEVSQIMRICAQEACPVIGWGAGTSLEGHGLAIRGGVTVDFSRMDQILEVHAEDMDVRVQPGVTREALNEALRATGLFFPVDPGANATLGGMAMTRASGTTAVRYGTMRDNVRALEVVLADGRVIQTGTRARKSSTGYDLTALMVGSEGTLGLVTELTLRLQGQPEAISAAVCAFDSLNDAVEAVTETIQMGIPMARIEFIDAVAVAAVNAYSGLGLPELPHLMLEFHGSDQAVAEQAERFGEIAADHGARGIDTATRQEDRTKLWEARHKAHWAVMAANPGKRALVTDACVPISHLAAAVAETQADIAASRLDGPILGHVGDGNFHAILLFDPDDPEDRAAVDDLSHRISERALHYGGTVSGEHGVGMGKLRYMQAEHGAGWDVMRTIKRALDPEDLLNPGKLVAQN